MSETVAIDLPAEPDSARRARKQLEVFRASVDEVSFVDLCLLVDELVVEALRDRNGATGEPIELRAECDGEGIGIAVSAEQVGDQRDAEHSEHVASEYPGDNGQAATYQWTFHGASDDAFRVNCRRWFGGIQSGPLMPEPCQGRPRIPRAAASDI